MLEVKGISKQFGGVKALTDVSLHLNAGEVLALAGDNGAGKSTLIKVISGVHAPDSGSLTYRGQPLRANSPLQARQLGIETIYQDLALADNLDVGANIFLGREPMKPFGGLGKAWAGHASPAWPPGSAPSPAGRRLQNRANPTPLF